jgi:hypothetical protein
MGRGRLALTLLALAVTAGAAARAASHRIITIDSRRVHPSNLTMRKEDVLEFVNYSDVPMILAFIEPQDHSDAARCHVAALGAAGEVAPDAFIWAAGYAPAAIIPPRRFVNTCSLAKGHYVFVTEAIGSESAGSVEQLGIKGTVTVE